MTAGKTVRGLGLISGGLDSMLAARLLMEQGIAVTGIAFVTPFFDSKNAEAAAARVGFPLIVRDITAPHLAMVKNPPSGYGRQMNPCIDCHALMLSVAGEVMDAEGFDFLFTGEVLNERPMSQSLRSLNRVANLSGRPGHVLRPLSALRLKETVVEREGTVDRTRLLDLEGRSRRRQFELAQDVGDHRLPERRPAAACSPTRATRAASRTCSSTARRPGRTSWSCSRSAASSGCARASRPRSGRSSSTTSRSRRCAAPATCCCARSACRGRW